MTILYRSVLLSVALLFAGCATQMGGPGMETRAADVGAEDNVLTLTQPKQADKFLPGPVE
nr:hypothetical protein [Nitrospinaceae bacterium]NIR55676.1 hypothetical protein [Nitrospinaceae bacterium]NIS86120.1 hypothetical protein [Nitrospinaceae bacterium]NIT82964.1 hypothetical protein [Nitrospinaceae bacterium]NIU45167.1 hypothetical protein [Nitrospinaceae bacterium]